MKFKSIPAIILIFALTLICGCSSNNSVENSDRNENNFNEDLHESHAIDSDEIITSEASDVIDAFVRAYCNGDVEAVYSLIYEKEIDLLNSFYGINITKNDIVVSISSEMPEAVATYNMYKDDHWISIATVYEDMTSELIAGNEGTPSYYPLGLEAAYMYDSVYFKNITNEMYIECISDDICCLKIDGKWYLCAGSIL